MKDIRNYYYQQRHSSDLSEFHPFSLKFMKTLLQQESAVWISSVSCARSGKWIPDLMARSFPDLIGKLVILELEKI